MVAGGSAGLRRARCPSPTHQVLTEVDLEPGGRRPLPATSPPATGCETAREADGYERVWLERMDPAA